MKNSRVKNIVFDLGGVLLEWNIDKIASVCYDSSELREKAKKDVFEHKDWHSLDEGTMKDEVAMERYRNRTGFPMEEIRRIVNIARHSLVPIPESHILLDDLRQKDYDLYCLSNMHEVSWELITNRFDFWDKFKGIVVSYALKMAKPDARIYEHLLSKYRLAPAQTIFIDDNRKNVEAAIKCGIHGILFHSAEDCRSKIEEIIRKEI